MDLFELLRNRMFFLVDKLLRNKKVTNVLTSLEEFDQSKNKSHIQNVKKDNLLADVKSSTEFYKTFGSTNFNQLPIITKEYLAENREKFISNRFNKDDLIKVSTSGSYGTPMSFYRTKQKQMRQIAEVIFLGKHINYYIGRHHAFIRGVSKNKINLLLQNEVHIDPTKLDEPSLEKMRKKVKKTKFIIGFPSVILSLIKYCEEMGDTSKDFKLLGIITTAEPLTENQRGLMKGFFNCNVVARYAMEELGLIATQCVHTENYHINEASFIVEVLQKESDSTATFGEEGRIIITDLDSNAMPLIRYDSGDFGVLQQRCSCGFDGKVLKTISGRKIQNILDSQGNIISPFSINVMMKDYENIYQFQFVQEGINQYHLLLITNSKFKGKESLLADLYKILGTDANIEVFIVDEIKPLPSGKRPYIINKLDI